MENLVTEARKYMSSDEGKDMMNKFESNQQGQTDSSESTYKPVQGGSGSNSFPSGEPQYGQGSNTENQYSTQNNNNNNNNNQENEREDQTTGGLAHGQQVDGGVNQFKGRESDYDGYEQGDSSATGGWGANKGGDSFARANQLGAETSGPFTSDPKSNKNGLDASSRSGTSTPAYAEEDDLDVKRSTQGGNGSSGLNPYGNNEDDANGNEGNPYHEQGRRV